MSARSPGVVLRVSVIRVSHPGGMASTKRRASVRDPGDALHGNSRRCALPARMDRALRETVQRTSPRMACAPSARLKAPISRGRIERLEDGAKHLAARHTTSSASRERPTRLTVAEASTVASVVRSPPARSSSRARATRGERIARGRNRKDRSCAPGTTQRRLHIAWNAAPEPTPPRRRHFGTSRRAATGKKPRAGSGSDPSRDAPARKWRS